MPFHRLPRSSKYSARSSPQFQGWLHTGPALAEREEFAPVT